LNLLIGSGSQMGDLLVDDPRLKAVSFTGSNDIGRRVHGLCGKRGAKVTCEMGGKNPALIWDDADLELALGGIVKGAFGSTGQRCTATSRLLLHEKIADKFLALLLSEMKKIKVGSGLDPDVGMGPAVDQSQLNTDLDYIDIAKKEGASLLYGGRRLQEGPLQHGYFIEPALIEGATPEMRIFKEEVFGPILSVSRVSSFEQALRWSNDVEFGLTCSIYTQDISLAMRYADECETGMVHINSPTIGGEAQVPFGGVKGSGVGEREMSKRASIFSPSKRRYSLIIRASARESNLY